MSIDKLDLQSPDLINENFEKLAALFPNCVTESAEGKTIDFDLLKQELSHAVIEGNRERYRLEWPGKREAIVTANLPTTKTLRPVREDSVDFDSTENLYIEGDNLEVLKLLQESYFGKVKMIYIDPPYNTGNDFVYRDNFTGDKQEELFESGQIDEQNQRLVANPESSGRYHSDWLSMMYPRLKLARNLLKNDGVIFISIDDGEAHNLKKMCDEIFGETNFVADLSVVNNLKGRNDKKYIARANERLLMYVKSDSFVEYGLDLDNKVLSEYSLNDSKGKYRLLELRKRGGADTRKERPNMYYSFYVHIPTGEVSLSCTDYFNTEALPVKSNGEDGRWRWGKDTSESNIDMLYGKLVGNKYNIYEKDYLESVDGARRIRPKSVLSGANYSTDVATKDYRALMGSIDFNNPKPVALISDLILYASPPCSNSIILDFFSGSATTAHAVMQLNAEDGGNRKYIMVQLPEQTDEKSEAYKAGYKNICEIGKERIRRAGNKVKDEKRVKAEKDGMFANYEDTQDFGFRVYRLDSSNMQDVYYRPQEYKQEALDLFADNIKPDRTADDLLAQVMLDWGLPLSYKIEQIHIQGEQVFRVAQDSLYACFDKGIDETFAKEIAKEKPLRIVFRDNGFANDTAKINVQQLLKQLSPETEMKVI